MNVSRAIIRQFASKSAPRSAQLDEGYAKLKKLQEHFQKPDDKPVFLKGGTSDQILYRFTVLLSLIGIGYMGQFFYEISNPPKQKDE